jgi:hypothetical protein
MYLLLQHVTEGFLKDLQCFKSLILKQSEGLKLLLKDSLLDAYDESYVPISNQVNPRPEYIFKIKK